MVTIITNVEETEGLKTVEVKCGKKTGSVSFWANGNVQVVCRNASHQVFRGIGRIFTSAQNAIDGYKSTEMKSIIEAAVSA